MKNNQVEEAVKLLKELEEKKGIFVDLPRYLKLIRACAEEGTLPYARDVHNNLIRSTIPIDVNTYNRILDMYSDCGSMSDAYEVFDKNMPERNIMSWDIMRRGLAKNDLGENAIDLFSQFKEEGLKPHGQIFMGVFLACSFLCDVGEGMLHFESMSKVYNIVPSMEHYWSAVNMLGSAGYLEEAMEFIRKMPFSPSVDVWETLMNLCRVHGNIELGCHCAEIVNCLDTSRLTDKSENGLVLGKASDAKKRLEQELFSKNVMDAEFEDGYTSHPDKDKIFAFLREIIVNLKAEGYVPDARYALHDLEEDKEEVSLHHCEKIVVAAGCLGAKPQGSFKCFLVNDCLCNDCHNAIKAISKLVGRKIILENGKTHFFEDGLCSCKDFWYVP
ncbi:Pentatricopeptide repeat-containing protein [Thalictrum thalictroides]|uniref:Pentatricopeptide repeat-containing protein n=1 Tax=Thalictrum thalictroides TaxID=46969 RepID=A0A7J6XC58_THATH|nr:Pentatricopeptide repeat-containing protein [Thalictrum thalictroides]